MPGAARDSRLQARGSAAIPPPRDGPDAERWQSGRMRRSRKPLSVCADPGFESLSLRHIPLKLLHFFGSAGRYPSSSPPSKKHLDAPCEIKKAEHCVNLCSNRPTFQAHLFPQGLHPAQPSSAPSASTRAPCCAPRPHPDCARHAANCRCRGHKGHHPARRASGRQSSP